MLESRMSRLSMELALRVDALVPDLFPGAKRSGGYWSIGSIAGDSGASLAICRRGGRAGKWTDYATGEHGDLLDLIGAVQSSDLMAAAEYADRWLGNAMVFPRGQWQGDASAGDVLDSDADQQRRLAALALWRDCEPADRVLVTAYFRARGLSRVCPPSLRLHRDLPCWCDHKMVGRFAAIVAAVQDSSGKITAVHRTFIAADGTSKADVPIPRQSLGPIGDGAIRLAKAGRTLGLAEGWEKALAAAELFALPVWSAIAAGRMGSVAVPECVENLILFADHDPMDSREVLTITLPNAAVDQRPNPMFGKRPGEESANRAAEIFRQKGLAVSIEYPERENVDWDDTLRERRAKGEL